MTPEDELAGRLIATAIDFRHTGDGEYPYVAQIDGSTIRISVNDFPAEPLYSVHIDERILCDLEDWPPAWTRERIPQALLDLVRDDPRALRAIDRMYGDGDCDPRSP